MLPAKLKDARHRLIDCGEKPMVGVEDGQVTVMVEVYISAACI